MDKERKKQRNQSIFKEVLRSRELNSQTIKKIKQKNHVEKEQQAMKSEN